MKASSRRENRPYSTAETVAQRSNMRAAEHAGAAGRIWSVASCAGKALRTGMRRGWMLLAATTVCAAAGGCMAHTQSVAVDVDARDWSRTALLSFTNSDTTTLRDLHLFVRCNERFEADSLPLRVMLLSPDSLRFEERFVLRTERSELPAARSRVCEAPFRSRVVLPDTGRYRLVIAPATPQRGIEAVGINIVKTE